MTVLRDGTPAEAGFDPARIELIKVRARQWVRGDTPSSVVLAARRGVIALHQGDGVARYGDSTPIATDAVFPCASLAKPVTATAIMTLVEDGLLSLNRPLVEYMPNFRGQHADRIMVHHLLTHTSGFIDENIDGWPIFMMPPDPGTAPAPGQNPHTHAVVSYYEGRDCFKKPGTQNSYCSANYTILGDLVRRVSGVRLGDFVRERIFQPLGMTSSSMGYSDDLQERFVTREDRTGGRMPKMMRVIGDDGGNMLLSTAYDLATFGQMFLNGGSYGGVRILNDWTTREMTRNQIPGIGCVNFHGQWTPEACWGYGWMIQGDARWPYSHGILQPRGTYYHQGGSGTALWLDPLHEIVGVYLSVAFMDSVTHRPNFEFDKYQNMVTAAMVRDER